MGQLATAFPLIEESPTDADAQFGRVGGVVGGEKVATVALIEMSVGHVEAHAFEGEIDVGVDPGIVAQLGAIGGVLESKHAHHRAVSGGVVAREVAHIGAQFGGQDAGHLKLQVEVGPRCQERERERPVVGTLLERQLVFPIQNAEAEVLAEGGADKLDVGGGLLHVHAILHRGLSGGSGAGGLRLLQEDVVLHGFQSHTEACGSVGESAFCTEAEHFVQILVPPGVATVEVLIVERRIFVSDKSAGFETQSVATQAEVEADVALEIKFAPVGARGAHFAQYVVAEGFGFFTHELCAEGDVVEGRRFLLLRSVGKREARQFVLGKEAHAGLHPAAEALLHFEGDGVLQGEAARLVVGLVGGVEEVLEERVLLRLGGKDPIVVRQAEGVDERGHGHKTACEGGVGHEGRGSSEGFCECVAGSRPYGQSRGALGLVHHPPHGVDIFVEAHRIAVGEKPLPHVERIAHTFQADGDVARLVAGGVGFGIDNVAVVFQSTVFHRFEVVAVEESVHLILVAAIAAVERAAESRVGLVLVVAAPVGIVDDEAYSGTFVEVGGKVGREAVVARLLAAGRMIGQMGNGRFGVGEHHSVCGTEIVRIRSGKDELRAHHIILCPRIDARDARRALCAEEVVSAVDAFGEVAVLKEVGEGVGFGWSDTAEALIDGPDGQPFGDGVGVDAVFVGLESIALRVTTTAERVASQQPRCLSRGTNNKKHRTSDAHKKRKMAHVHGLLGKVGKSFDDLLFGGRTDGHERQAQDVGQVFAVSQHALHTGRIALGKS